MFSTAQRGGENFCLYGMRRVNLGVAGRLQTRCPSLLGDAVGVFVYDDVNDDVLIVVGRRSVVSNQFLSAGHAV